MLSMLGDHLPSSWLSSAFMKSKPKLSFFFFYNFFLCGPLFKSLLSFFTGGSDGKASAYSAGNLGSIPGLGRSPGEGNGNPLQYSCLKNPMDGGAWRATVHGVTKSWTWLSDFTIFGQEACEILVQPGIKPTPLALKGEVLTTRPPGKSPKAFLNPRGTFLLQGCPSEQKAAESVMLEFLAIAWKANLKDSFYSERFFQSCSSRLFTRQSLCPAENQLFPNTWRRCESQFTAQE